MKVLLMQSRPNEALCMGLRSRSACQRATTPGQALTTLAARRPSDEPDAGRAASVASPSPGVAARCQAAWLRSPMRGASCGRSCVSRALSRAYSWLSPQQRSHHGGYQTTLTQVVRGRALRSGFFSFRNLPAPEMVPPVPTPATRKSILPPVCALRPLAGSVLWLKRSRPADVLLVTAVSPHAGSCD